MHENRERKAGAVLSYFSIIANTLVGLLYTPFLIRMLGQSEYGLYSLVASIIGYLTVFDFGFGNAVIVYTAKYRARKEYDKERRLQGMFFVIFCIIAAIVAALGTLLFFLLPTFFSDSMTEAELSKAKILVIILIINLVINFIFTIYSSIITAYEKFVFQKALNILSIMLKPAIMIPLLFLGYKSITMAIVVSVINFSILFANYIFCKKKLKVSIHFDGFDKTLFKEILRYSFYIFLGIIVDKINYNVDNFVLGAVSGMVAVSVYSVAISIDELFRNISTAISGIMLPKVTKMIAKNASDEDITTEFIKIGRLQFYIVFLIASGFILVGKEFILSWVGADFIDAYYICIILMIPSCVPLIQNLGISILQAKNMHKFRSVLYVIIALFNIAISIPLAKMYQGIGAAIGTSIAVIIGNIIIINIYYHVKAKINIIKFWKTIVGMIIPLILPIILIILFINFTQFTGYSGIIIYGGFYTILYTIVCYTFVMNPYEKKLLNSVIKKVNHGKIHQ